MWKCLYETFLLFFQTDTMFKWLFIFNEVLSIRSFASTVEHLQTGWLRERQGCLQRWPSSARFDQNFRLRIFNLKMSNESHSLGDHLDAPEADAASWESPVWAIADVPNLSD